MQYEIFCELVALYALDLLDEPSQRMVEEAIAVSPELETELAAFQAAVADIPYGIPVLPMAAELKERLFQRIAQHSADETAVNSVLDSSYISALKAQANEVSWEPYSIPGIMVGKLFVDPVKREVTYFIRSIAGVKFPSHIHAGEEEIVVLEGDLAIDGKVYGIGECICSAPGTVHQPETYGGCLIFLRTSLNDSILT